MKWSEFKAVLRRSVLMDMAADGEEEQKFSSAMLLDALTWAQDALCAHTALPAVMCIRDGEIKNPSAPETTWDLASERDFPLPSNIYETVDLTGIVYVTDAQGREPLYFDPLFHTRNLTPYADADSAFWSDSTTLHLTTPPGKGKVLWVRYFAYYPAPATATDDEFELLVPAWALGPIAHLCGAYALLGRGLKSADIRQWNDRQDSGKPQDNALEAYARFLVSRYEQEIARHMRQDRVNYFRVRS